MEFKVGDRVTFQPERYKVDDMFEIGIIREIADGVPGSVEVVIFCNNDWDNINIKKKDGKYKYKSNLIETKDLTLGFRYE